MELIASFLADCWNAILTIGTASSLYGLVTAGKQLSAWMRHRRTLRNVLKGAKEWAVIIPLYDGRFEKQEDMEAALIIRDWCKKMRVECRIMYDTDEVPSGASLFFVCGPAKNKQVSNYYRSFDLELAKKCLPDGDKGEDNPGSIYVIRDSASGAEHKSGLDEGGQYDCAILSRRKMTGGDNRFCIFCLGIHAQGSLGAAKMLTSKRLMKKLSHEFRKLDSFESIVRTPCSNAKLVDGEMDFVMPPRNVQR